MRFSAENEVKTSNFSFSHVGLDKLGGDGYTLVDINVDVSGSISGREKNIESMLKTIVEACRNHPRHNNLLIRVTHFGSDVNEFHGYTLLSEIVTDDYDGSIRVNGMTALVDAICAGAESGWSFGKTLYDKDYDVNHISFTLTDGGENCSTLSYSDIPKKVAALKSQEYLESSLNFVFHIGDYVEELKKAGGIDAFMNYNDLTKESLAKVARFVDESVSSQSQHLGSGGPSKVLSF